jgi:malonate decarboxylase gamma subunit
MHWQSVCDSLFLSAHDVKADGDYLYGQGRCGAKTVSVIGTTRHVEIGVELAFRMAGDLLQIIRRDPGRPILFLIDTIGQRLRRRDELLGLNGYVAHLAKCVELARTGGHRVIGLVYDQALSGGFLATGMMADICAALPDAKIRVMGIPAMARVSRISEDRLRELAASSAVFAPGAENYVLLGGVDSLWSGDLGERLRGALASSVAGDERAKVGADRGGRRWARVIADRIVKDDARHCV